MEMETEEDTRDWILEGFAYVNTDFIVEREHFEPSLIKKMQSNTAIQTVMNKVQTKFMPGEEVNDYQTDDFNRLVGEGLVEVLKDESLSTADVPPKVTVIVASDAHKNWLNEIEDVMKNRDADIRDVVLVVFGQKFYGQEMFKAGVQIKNMVHDYDEWKVVKESSEVRPPSRVDNSASEPAISRVMCLAKTWDIYISSDKYLGYMTAEEYINRKKHHQKPGTYGTETKGF